MNRIWLNAVRASGAGVLWTPASPTTSGGVSPHTWQVPGVANFQDAAKTTPADEVGDVIGAMVNQGSDTHDVTQGTTANKPTLQQVTINSVVSYVWRFDGVDDFLQGAFGGGAISQPYTVFLMEIRSTDGYTIDGDDGTNRMAFFSISSMTMFAGQSLTSGVSDSNPNIWTLLFNGGSSQFWKNGVSFASGNAGTQTPDGITVASRYSIGFNLQGDIGQILIYPGNLSTADKNEVGEYLERVTGIVWTTIV